MELGIIGKIAIFFDKRFKLHLIKNPLLIVEDNQIVDIGEYAHIKGSLTSHEIVGDKNQIIFPGLINTHTHLAMTLFRGIADDIPLNTWLTKHIWPIENKLEAEDVYLGAKLGAIESLLAGVTTVNSMYWKPNQESKAMKETGIRGMVGAPVITGKNDLKTAVQVISDNHNKAQGRIKATLALHSPYTVTISDFQEATDYVQDRNEQCSDFDKIFIHTHLAEPENEIEQAKKFNKEKGEDFPEKINTSVELLNTIDVLKPDLLAAHCIHVTEPDIKILKDKNVKVTVNPLSNSKLGNHMPPLPKLVQNINDLGLGTDGPASNNTLNLFETIRYITLYYKGFKHDSTIISAEKAFKMATIGGAKALNWKGLGTLEIGSYADIITMNLKKPHLAPIISDDSYLSHFAYAMNGADVENVIVDGELVVKKRDFQYEKIEDVIEDVQKTAEKLVEKANT